MELNIQELRRLRPRHAGHCRTIGRQHDRETPAERLLRSLPGNLPDQRFRTGSRISECSPGTLRDFPEPFLGNLARTPGIEPGALSHTIEPR